MSLANYATPDLADAEARPNNPNGAGRPPKEDEDEDDTKDFTERVLHAVKKGTL